MQMFTGLFKPPDWFNDVMGLWLNVEDSGMWGWDKMAAIFAHDILKWIFLNENFWISNKMSLKYVP